MALFTENRLRSKFSNDLKKSVPNADLSSKLVIEALKQKAIQFNKNDNEKYDIFLSHSIKDALIIFGLVCELEDLGYSVYVDWKDDPQLDRSKVTKTNAAILKKRMKQCKVLLYAFSTNAINSKWTSWELGFFDGYNGRVALVPITEEEEYDFTGSEFLGIYPYVQVNELEGSIKSSLWVHNSIANFESFKDWSNI